MNENELFVVKKYKSDNPIITDVDFITENYFNDCRDIYFHEVEYECIFHFKLKNITENEMMNPTVSDKSVDEDGVNNELKVVEQKGFFYLIK